MFTHAGLLLAKRLWSHIPAWLATWYTDSKSTAMVRRTHAPENHRPPLHVDEDVEPLHVVNAVSSECVVVGVVLEIARVLLANPHEPCDGRLVVVVLMSAVHEWWW